MPTINDVAKKAGVSITTVSYVISGKRFVSDSLKNQVIQAMKDIGYKPNNLARSLRLGKTDTIGLVIPDSSNLFFAEIAKYIEDIGFKNGYTVFLCNSDDMIEKQREYIDVLIAKQVDGIVFISVSNDQKTILSLIDADIPFIIVDREDEHVRSDIVLVDNQMGGYLATSHLISLGHTKIGTITGPSPVNPSSYRHQGYIKALNDHNIDLKKEYVVSGDFRFMSGFNAMKKLLGLKDPPSAVFIQNDMMVLGAYRAIDEFGLSVPKDISIIGFDDSPIAEILTPSLSTIAQPITKITETTMNILFKRIRGDDDGFPARIILKPELIIRDSCNQLLERN